MTLLEVNSRQEKLIDGLLVLAAAEQAVIEREAVDLADVAAHAVTACAAAATALGVVIRTEAGIAAVLGDRVLLERLAQNLLENAICYNRGRERWVSVTTWTIDGRACLVVENSGPVIPAEEIPGLFEPFRRRAATERLGDPGPAATDRGAGLGLSIVRSIARAHHGEVHAESRSEGGLRVHARLPARAESTSQPGVVWSVTS